MSSINYNHSLPAETPNRTKNRSCFTKFHALHFLFLFNLVGFYSSNFALIIQEYLTNIQGCIKAKWPQYSPPNTMQPFPPFSSLSPRVPKQLLGKKNQQNNQPTEHLGTEKRLTEQPRNHEQKNLQKINTTTKRTDNEPIKRTNNRTVN